MTLSLAELRQSSYGLIGKLIFLFFKFLPFIPSLSLTISLSASAVYLALPAVQMVSFTYNIMFLSSEPCESIMFDSVQLIGTSCYC